MRLRADFWVSAYLRRCDIEGLAAVLRRRGSAEAGGIYIKQDRLNGRATLFGPGPQADESGAEERRFIRLHKDPDIEIGDAETRLAREISFDSDIWIIEIECQADEIFIEVLA